MRDLATWMEGCGHSPLYIPWEPPSFSVCVVQMLLHTEIKSYYKKIKRNLDLDLDLLLLSPALQKWMDLGLDFKSHKQHFIQMTREKLFLPDLH